MSLYHGFDMKYRELQESFKKIQEAEISDVEILRKIIAIKNREKMALDKYKKSRGSIQKHMASQKMDDISEEKMRMVDWIKDNRPNLLNALRYTLETGKIDRSMLGESFKKIQEDEYDDYKAALAADQGTSITPAEEGPGERAGLEGPFRMHNGKTYYYDPKEGKYYDHTTDMYVDTGSEEFYQLTGMKKVGESIEESDGGRVEEANNYFRKAFELMKKAEGIYDSDRSTIDHQIESSKILEAMEDLELLLTDPEGYHL